MLEEKKGTPLPPQQQHLERESGGVYKLTFNVGLGIPHNIINDCMYGNALTYLGFFHFFLIYIARAVVSEGPSFLLLFA